MSHDFDIKEWLKKEDLYPQSHTFFSRFREVKKIINLAHNDGLILQYSVLGKYQKIVRNEKIRVSPYRYEDLFASV